MRQIEVMFGKNFRAALTNALESHFRALPGRIDANGDLGPSKTAKMAQNNPKTARLPPEKHISEKCLGRKPLRLTPYGDGLAENGFSDPISDKIWVTNNYS